MFFANKRFTRSSESEPEFASERKLMRLKACEKIKVSSLPKSAADLRAWKNSLISQLVSCCKSERELLAWPSRPLEGEEVESSEFPVLNRILGSKLLEAAKGSCFGVDFQASQERSIRQGKQVQGHLLLSRICRKFRLDKERGMSLSQQHLLALKPQGGETKDLEVFRDRTGSNTFYPVLKLQNIRMKLSLGHGCTNAPKMSLNQR